MSDLPVRHVSVSAAQVSGADRIGMALGGGAVLGAAHIGILKAFDEKEVPIGCISGTSIGAFIAGLYAFGIGPDRIEELVRDMNWLDVSGLNFPKFGLFSNEKLGRLIKEMVGNVCIEEAEIPLAVVVTDIGKGTKVVAKRGSLADYVMASACIPGIFSPVRVDGRMLVDGALVENVPISPLRSMGADLTVGVDLNANRRFKEPEDIIDVLVNAIDITIDYATRLQVDEVGLLIAPDLNAYNRNDSGAVDDLIKIGYEAAISALAELFDPE